MVTEKVMELLKEIYKNLDELVNLIGLEYTEDEEYVCHNRDQVDEEWCDEEMLESISCAHSDIGYFVGYSKGDN